MRHKPQVIAQHQPAIELLQAVHRVLAVIKPIIGGIVSIEITRPRLRREAQ